MKKWRILPASILKQVLLQHLRASAPTSLTKSRWTAELPSSSDAESDQPSALKPESESPPLDRRGPESVWADDWFLPADWVPAVETAGEPEDRDGARCATGQLG